MEQPHVLHRFRIPQTTAQPPCLRSLLRGLALLFVTALTLFCMSCGVQRPHYVAGVPEGLVAPGESADAFDRRREPERDVKTREVKGKATWYGDRHHGRLTANGETFDMHAFTAAHRTLPFNTVVRVTHTKTGESVLVRINDRGPGKKSLVIDLSKKAARALKMVKRGVAPVQLEIVSWGDGARYHHGRKTLPKKKRRARRATASKMTQKTRVSKANTTRPNLRVLPSRGGSEETPQLRPLHVPPSDPKDLPHP